MLSFILRRLGVIALTMLCLTLIVFFLINLDPNLKKLAITQTEMRATAEQQESWLQRNGYRQNFFIRYGQWLGVWPKQPVIDPATGEAKGRFAFCDEPAVPTFSGILQGDFGCSTKYKVPVAQKLFPALGATGLLMFWVMVTMVPIALLVGILAGMREGSRTDRTLSVASIATTATPEYVSGVIFAVIFASWLGWLNGSAASATSQGITFYNFTLPVMTMAIYGIGYIARMTRASMVEVMTQQYIRTARLKGLSVQFGGHQARLAQRPYRSIHRDHAAVPVAAYRRRHRRDDVPLPRFWFPPGRGCCGQRHRPFARLFSRLGVCGAVHAASVRCRLRLSQPTYSCSVGGRDAA